VIIWHKTWPNNRHAVERRRFEALPASPTLADGPFGAKSVTGNRVANNWPDARGMEEA